MEDEKPTKSESERIKELKKMEKERQKEIKKRQKEALQKFREEQNKQIEKDSEQGKENRLKYLIEQSEIFAHFMGNYNQVQTPTKKKPTKENNSNNEKDTPNKRNQTKEGEEDQELLQNAKEDEKKTSTIVIGNPSCKTKKKKI